MRTFTDSESFLAYMQARYGSANFAKWQSVRKQFYSYVLYPVAGVTQLNFFGNSVGANSQVNGRQLTNMPKAGSFGQNHFLLKSINCKYFIADKKFSSWDGTQATTLVTEITDGVFNCGVFELVIGSRTELQIVKPFQYMPPADGQDKVVTAGNVSLTTGPLAEVTSAPSASLGNRKNKYLVDPNIFIEAEQNFEGRIVYQSGAVPVTATTVVNDTTNPLYVGLEFDGILYRPQQ